MPPPAPQNGGIKKRNKKKKRKHAAQQHGEAEQKKLPAAAAPSNAAEDDFAPSDKRARKMAEQLAGAQFRYINEQLYTRPSAEAVALFAEEPALYDAYHVGFRLQAARWPLRPVQAISEWLKATKPASHVVADLGCGDAELAASVPQRMHSFDLVAAARASSRATLPTCCPTRASTSPSSASRSWAELCRLPKRGAAAQAKGRAQDSGGRLAHQCAGLGGVAALGFDHRAIDASNTHVLYEHVKSKRPPADAAGAIEGVSVQEEVSVCPVRRLMSKRAV